jgi:hypothetical protein
VKTIPLSSFGLVSVAEVATFHGDRAYNVCNWIRAGRLPPVRLGLVDFKVSGSMA